MRTLKKTMCLVLVLVMLLGLGMITASSTDFTDDAQINETFAEAAEVLDGLGVFTGYEDGSFQPKSAITRGEVAAVLYRVLTGDVDNKQVGIYADYNKFTDVASSTWYAGYINYVANGKYVAGNGDGTFSPDNNVTGYQVLAMMLRAIGYGQNGEFEGDGWEIRTATLAKSLGITKNIMEGTLGGSATREMVAEMIFQAITEVPTVTWNPLTGYNKYETLWQETENANLGWQVFRLDSTWDRTIDMWGRPGYYWYKDNNRNGGWDSGETIATIVYEPDAVYTTAVPECDIAHDIGLTSDKTFTLVTNGTSYTDYIVQPTDTVQRIGEQGTLTEVYYGYGQNNDQNRIVTIDTFLAKVTDVRAATYDANNHLIDDATIELEVYEGSRTTPLAPTVILRNGKNNYTYSKGDYLLVSVQTANYEPQLDGTMEVWSVQKNWDGNTKLRGDDIAKSLLNGVGEIHGVAPSSNGSQTYIHYNARKHTIDGSDYNDAKWFRLDQAGTDISAHTWLRDNYGNLIGAIDITNQYAYGVIENIQWVNPLGEAGYARATMRYMDGSTGVVTVRSVDDSPWETTDDTILKYSQDLSLGGNNASYANRLVSTVLQYNRDADDPWYGQHLYRVDTRSDGAVDLKHAYTYDSTNPLTDSYRNHLDSAKISTGSAYILGDVGSALPALTVSEGTTKAPTFVRINEKTQFLIRSGSGTSVSYTTVTGYQNMGNYTGAIVDYVDLDGDSYADYVYVRGTASSTDTVSLFYLTSYTYREVLLNNGTYYEFTGLVNNSSTPTTISVIGGAPGANPAAVIMPSIGTGTNNTLYQLFKITTGPSGRVYRVERLSDGYDLSTAPTLTGDVKVLSDKGAIVRHHEQNVGTWRLTDTAIDTGTGVGGQLGAYGITPVYGAWKEDLTDRDVWVIYDPAKVSDKDSNVIIAAYVSDPSNGALNSNPSNSGSKDVGITPGVMGPETPAGGVNEYNINVALPVGSSQSDVIEVLRNYLAPRGFYYNSYTGGPASGTFYAITGGSVLVQFHYTVKYLYPVTVTVNGNSTIYVGTKVVKTGDVIYVGASADSLGVSIRNASGGDVYAKQTDGGSALLTMSNSVSGTSGATSFTLEASGPATVAYKLTLSDGTIS